MYEVFVSKKKKRKRKSNYVRRMSSGKRLQVLNSHISGGVHQNPTAMASEKDAALAAVPSDSPTISELGRVYVVFSIASKSN
ncbi:hypothetical protein HanOQP8_Chr17g0647881 [Helianthus annuus]|nr:hypothetical protein HanLR1_Chr17g0652251 [Helianthus annuus]KAJ0635166.1 hypothetical protein HanOQP8_Chr17g0647881 [Helianthus annuus]